MRHELCVDNRNEPKWSITTNAADEVDACAIVYAAMFIPDQNKHGHERDPWDNQNQITPTVRDFFVQERLALQTGGQNDLWRIANLDDRIRVLEVRYHWDQQVGYVHQVMLAVAQARTDDRPVVLLLDPCNGIANTRHGRGRVRHRRVHARTVASIWGLLRAGDVLVIWQWPQPERIPAHNPVTLLATAIQQAGSPLPVAGIKIHHFGPFVMLELRT